MKTHLELVIETWGSVENYVKAVWGPEATFDLVDKLCLIHLDKPAGNVRQARANEAAKRHAELGEADCPLCREMAEAGGDEVFDGGENDGKPKPIENLVDHIVPSSGRVADTEVDTYDGGTGVDSQGRDASDREAIAPSQKEPKP